MGEDLHRASSSTAFVAQPRSVSCNDLCSLKGVNDANVFAPDSPSLHLLSRCNY